MLADVFVKFHMHQPVFLKAVHLACLGLARLQKPQGFGDRHLVDKHLILAQWCFRYAVPGLDHRGLSGFLGGCHPGGFFKELADGHRIGGVIRPLVDHLEDIPGRQGRGTDLHPARAPTIRHRHLAAGKGHLIAGYGQPFQDRTADHALGLFVQIGKVIGLVGHSAASGMDVVSASRRSLRTSSNSDWKST